MVLDVYPGARRERTTGGVELSPGLVPPPRSRATTAAQEEATRHVFVVAAVRPDRVGVDSPSCTHPRSLVSARHLGPAPVGPLHVRTKALIKADLEVLRVAA